jgi:Ras family protein T1
MDLFRPSSTAGVTDEQVMARSRQQIVSLMQRFRFIRQCIKCSAKNLLRVDEVFLKAQQAVLYPFAPLYDLEVGRLSQECQQAFTRIFRIYDRDHDGLLSHTELDRFQHDTFHTPVYERDLTGWKKVVTRNNPTNEEVVRDGKFTVAGFLAIFDVFISQNRLDVPWQALRKFGYDDDLKLHIPEDVLQLPDEGAVDESSWSLSPSARRFLTDLFLQFDSDHDGVLSPEDVQAMFSIVPQPSLPPWHPVRAPVLFRGCFGLPKIPPASNSPGSESPGEPAPMGMSQSLSASGITIVSGDSFPTVDLSNVHRSMHPISKQLSFLDWMGLWHAISAISPAMTRAELFHLGHIEDSKRGKRKRSRKKSTVSPGDANDDLLLPSRELRVLVLGSPGSGKTALLNGLCGVRDALRTTKTKSPETSSTYVRLNRTPSSKSGKADEDEPFVVHLVFTEVPEAEAEYQAQRKKELSEILSGRGCDLVLLAFDSTNSASLAYVKHLESSFLTDDMPRVYVGTKADQSRPTDERGDDDEWQDITVDEAAMHCRELDLEPPLLTSASASMLSADGEAGAQECHKALGYLARCCLLEAGVGRLRSKPHEEKKRREAARRRNRKIMWFGVGVGVAVAMVGYLWTGGKGSKAADRGADRLGWIRSWFSRPLSSATTATATTAAIMS